MSFAALAFYGWLMLGWMPDGFVGLYENPLPEKVVLSGSFVSELGAEANWGPLFAGGVMRVPMWWVGSGFWPGQLESTVDAGVKWEGIRVGWQHTCYHPVVPYLSAITLSGRQVVPRYEGGYDMLYLRVEGGKR